MIFSKTKSFSFHTVIPFGIVILSLGLFLFGIERPAYRYFDEVQYVSAAQQMILHGTNENWSHPPLGKALIGLGILNYGDQPLGWRIMSAIAGSLGLLGMFFLSRQIFANLWAAGGVVALSVLNQIHFIQSRVATLDVFMFAFMIFGFWLFSVVEFGGRSKRDPRMETFLLYGSGLCFGLAGACKWFGLIPILPILFLLLRRKFFWSHLFAFAIFPIFTYGIALLLAVEMKHPEYAPTLGAEKTWYSVWQLIELQSKMLVAQSQFNPVENLGQSSWPGWPLDWKPMWMDFRRIDMENGQSLTQGILYLGNPVIFLAGLFATGFCLWNYWKVRSRESEFILLCYFVLWLIWSILPRSAGYLYYYYPAAMMMNLTIVQALRLWRPRRWVIATFFLVSWVTFLFFYPLISGLAIPDDSLPLAVIFKFL